MDKKEEYLMEFERVLAEYDFGEEPSELYDPIYYTLAMKAKRLRPLLCIASYALFDDKFENAVLPALAVEVFHNFTLIHDDIMDKAPLRRGQETVYKKWNTPIAILSGDAMLVKVYDILSKVENYPLSELIDIFNKYALEVCEGQQLDMNYEDQPTISEQEYLGMIRLKTAALMAGSIHIGATLSTKDDRTIKNLVEFGYKLGAGFQLMDDYLDVFADKAKFGKQVGGDIIENKKTFLLIKALELAQGNTKSELKDWLEKKEFDNEEKVSAVKNIYADLQIGQLTKGIIKAHYDEAIALLNDVQANMEAKSILEDLAVKLVDRDN